MKISLSLDAVPLPMETISTPYFAISPLSFAFASSMFCLGPAWGRRPSYPAPCPCVHDRDLAARTVRGVQPERDLIFDGRLHQERAQIHLEHSDRLFARSLGEVCADLALDGGEQKAVAAVLHRLAHEAGALAAVFEVSRPRDALGDVLVDGDLHAEEPLLFAAVDREHAVALDLADGLAVVGVHLIGARALLFGVGEAGDEFSVLHEEVADLPAHVRVVGDDLGDDVLRARKRVLRGRDALFLVDILRRLGVHVCGLVLREQELASGCNPRSMATPARVFFFCLYGR